MPRPLANVTVQQPTSPSVHLRDDDVTKLRGILGVRVLPDGFLRRLEDAINLCRQHVRRQMPSEAQAHKALELIAEHARALVALLGRPGDAIAGPLARLRRCLPEGFDKLREVQGDLEELLFTAQWATNAPPAHDLDMSARAAKVSMAARIAELLDDYSIVPVTTTEPRLSVFLAVVQLALGYVGGGDLRSIPAEGLHTWREYVRQAMAGPDWYGYRSVP